MSEEINTAPLEAALLNTDVNSNESISMMEESKIRELIEERRQTVETLRAKTAISANVTSHTDCKPKRPCGSLQTGNSAWQEPSPITARATPKDYPVDSLPLLIREAVIEVQAATQAPMAIVASSAICAMATASQALIDVQRDNHLFGPVSLYFVVLGDSGERKSTVDALFSKSIKEFHQKSMAAGAEELAVYRAQRHAWQAKCDGIAGQIKSINSGKKKESGSGICELERNLSELHKQEPERPLIPNVLVLDITTEKLAHQLAKEWPSCALVSAEGGLVFGGRSLSKENQLSTLAAFNALWSNEPLRISRKTSESFEISGARLSISLFVQSQVFENYIEENDIARSIGFLARCLFAFPESTQGKRNYKPMPKKMVALETFNAHISRVFGITPTMNKNRLVPTLVALDDDAKVCWIKFHDEIEAQLAAGKMLEGLRDFGSKAAEIAARVAAVFQAADGFPIITISENNMESACQIVKWHISEVIRFFGTCTTEEHRLMADAKKLDSWFVHYCRETEATSINLIDILQRGPGSLRKKEKLKAPLEFLESRQRIKISSNSRSIEVNPALLKKDANYE
jgi:putative DNA primase/helicase